MEIEKDSKIIKSSIRSDLNYMELVLEGKEPYQDNYQVRMIKENPIPNILKVTASGVDGRSQYLYDISGMRSIKRELERNNCDKKYIEKFLKILLRVISAMSNYMLDINFLILNPEFIYTKNEEYYFCYFPGYEGNILESFHELTEFFVREIDYSDYATVVLVCGMHKATMEDQYEIQSIIQQYTTSKPEHEEIELFSEDIETEDAPELEQNMIREAPIKRFWNQRKKDKWGTWDDLLISEESSIMEKNHN